MMLFTTKNLRDAYKHPVKIIIKNAGVPCGSRILGGKQNGGAQRIDLVFTLPYAIVLLGTVMIRAYTVKKASNLHGVPVLCISADILDVPGQRLIHPNADGIAAVRQVQPHMALYRSSSKVTCAIKPRSLS